MNAKFAACAAMVSLLLIPTQSKAEQEVVQKLESFTTQSGRTYTEVVVRKRTKDQVTIMHSSGSATLPVSEIPPELLSDFGFDPEEVAAVAEARDRGLLRLLSYHYNGTDLGHTEEKIQKLGAYPIHGKVALTMDFELDPKTLGHSEQLEFEFKVADVSHAASESIVRLSVGGRIIASAKGAKRGETKAIRIPRSKIGAEARVSISLQGGKNAFMLEHANGLPLVTLKAVPLTGDEVAAIRAETARVRLREEKLAELRKAAKPRTFIVDRITPGGDIIAWSADVSWKTTDQIPRAGRGGSAPSSEVAGTRHQYLLSGIPNAKGFSRFDYVGGMFAEDGTRDLGGGIYVPRKVYLGLKTD